MSACFDHDCPDCVGGRCVGGGCERRAVESERSGSRRRLIRESELPEEARDGNDE